MIKTALRSCLCLHSACFPAAWTFVSQRLKTAHSSLELESFDYPHRHTQAFFGFTYRHIPYHAMDGMVPTCSNLRGFGGFDSIYSFVCGTAGHDGRHWRNRAGRSVISSHPPASAEDCVTSGCVWKLVGWVSLFGIGLGMLDMLGPLRRLISIDIIDIIDIPQKMAFPGLERPWNRSCLGLEDPKMKQILSKTKFVSLGSFCASTVDSCGSLRRWSSNHHRLRMF